ncbi:MAG: bifunctional phosphopantothenoylcysteine decarboxylase/phosphopantothenate--cysteine ligase CoaBC [Desulfotomaculaceae bacterium]|nr:bifunctional phosphopantothenoylcysteine decarboxylase/phosphopantothenate--cysteine ligase CoaBC [Desulfotomaculaceae bacterium]MDD4767754.1 bifunctional phosphopantothenoylcysteine decarboxylase/phosphopantothenate--cysteine ligase CoaBC [Desulfotomaculaceae bacterium]
MLAEKRITVGITGGIAVFKAAQLVSSLKAGGFEVNVIMTRSAQEFVKPLTFQVLSGNTVRTELFDSMRGAVQHIELATRPELIVIAPATANILGKVANGIADDLLTTVIMAASCPVLFCPAMNVNMYNNVVVQRNIATLRELGYEFVEPGTGRLACGVEGRGRLADLDLIMEKIKSLLSPCRDMEGLTVMVTAGPTVEPIDPVRYITNRSTGKMGYAVAGAAAGRGAKTLLVSGPTVLKPPEGVELINVETAAQMYEAVMEHYPGVDIVVKTAAVADYRPREVCSQKIKKHEGSLSLALVRNHDILAELGRRKNKQVLVGFAAETSDLEENSLQKVTGKNLDFLVANDITQAGAGFGSDTNIVKFVYPGGDVQQMPLLDKTVLARRILDEALAIRQKRE